MPLFDPGQLFLGIVVLSAVYYGVPTIIALAHLFGVL
jgi:hypothetical protein